MEEVIDKELLAHIVIVRSKSRARNALVNRESVDMYILLGGRHHSPILNFGIGECYHLRLLAPLREKRITKKQTVTSRGASSGRIIDLSSKRVEREHHNVSCRYGKIHRRGT